MRQWKKCERASKRKRGRWSKSVAIESWIMIYRFWNLLVSIHSLSASVCTHVRLVYTKYFSVRSAGETGHCGPHFIHKHTNPTSVSIGRRSSKINSVGIDFELRLKFQMHTYRHTHCHTHTHSHTQQPVCVDFGLGDCAFVCICWLIRKAKSIRRKIQYKRYCVCACMCVK